MIDRFTAPRHALTAVFLSLVALATLPTSATAFVVDSQRQTTSVGTCTLLAEGTYEDDHFYYGLAIFGGGSFLQTFITNDGANGSSVISPAWIASNCGVTDVSISSYIQANPSVSFADHSELWLSFQYTDPDDGLVHYATAAAQGQTGTTVFVTDTTTAPAPTEASFTFTPPPQTLPAAITFTDTTPQLADRIVTSWFWDFGDGNTSTAANPTHSYASYNTFTVELTICDTYDCDTETQTLTIAEPDTTAPSVTLSGLPATVSGLDPISLSVEFDEDVTGFEPGDLAISGATVTSLTGGPASYTLVITPTGAAAISVQVPAGVYRQSGKPDRRAKHFHDRFFGRGRF
ncbi:PKD domain-containing protein [Abyssibius alkaniclasticus]|uniref:PKD domain-containing protein n=1 Tax=Abyssibius alkaniclasticus TaxID=2881234 RepID=UPI00405848C6